jgi:hypothetical protein
MKTLPSPAARRNRRGGILMGLLVTAAALVCVAIVIGLAVARNVRVETFHGKDGNNVSINTPGGNFTIRAHDHDGKAFVDLPIYPGAKQVKSSGGAEFEWTSGDGLEQKGFNVAGGEVITPDPASKVFDYYHTKLPSWIVSHERDGQIKLAESLEGDGKRFVIIHEKFDGTHIGVASIGTPAAN